MVKSEEKSREIIATNRKIHQHYHVLEAMEAGLSLKGSEVKSVRSRKVSLEQSFARVDGEEVLLFNMHIAPYTFNTGEPLDPTRTRKLLLKKREIKKLIGQTAIKGLALVPLDLYFKRGWAKITLGIVKGKKGPDRRQEIKRRDIAREMEKEFKGKFKV
ncbi:MAG: SsrA-binding protein SmpB [Elusimicrobia bacterium]|nr:SsrA-binding protein SmpB [Elusimicrobiota bacterium]